MEWSRWSDLLVIVGMFSVSLRSELIQCSLWGAVTRWVSKRAPKKLSWCLWLARCHKLCLAETMAVVCRWCLGWRWWCRWRRWPSCADFGIYCLSYWFMHMSQCHCYLTYSFTIWFSICSFLLVITVFSRWWYHWFHCLQTPGCHESYRNKNECILYYSLFCWMIKFTIQYICWLQHLA